MLSAIIGAAGALGSAIFGGIKSAQANRKAQQLIQQQRDDNRRWYNTKMNQDYTQRVDVQNAITRQRELLDEQIKRANARQVVGGGSEESAALAKEAANKSVADATADIAAAGANYKDQVEQQYRAQDAQLNQQQIQNYQQQAQQSAAAASQGVNAGLGLIGADSSLGGATAAAKQAAKNSVQQATQAKMNQMNQPTVSATGLGASALKANPTPIQSFDEMDATREVNMMKIPV